METPHIPGGLHLREGPRLGLSSCHSLFLFWSAFASHLPLSFGPASSQDVARNNRNNKGRGSLLLPTGQHDGAVSTPDHPVVLQLPFSSTITFLGAPSREEDSCSLFGSSSHLGLESHGIDPSGPPGLRWFSAFPACVPSACHSVGPAVIEAKPPVSEKAICAFTGILLFQLCNFP